MIRHTLRALRIVFYMWCMGWIIVAALTILNGCGVSKDDARRRYELNQQVFVKGTTEALKNGPFAPRKPTLPATRH